MKKNVLMFVVTAFISVPLLMSAQSPVDKFFEKYAGQDGYTTVNISKDMFEMFASMGDANDTSSLEMKKMMDQLSGLKVLTSKVDSLKPAKANAFYNEAAALFPSSSYKELMTVNDDGENIKFLTKQSSPGKISEMVMLMKGKHEVVVMSLTGNIDLSTVSKLSKTMNIHGMEGLQKMKEEHHKSK
jgi:hypothetical protein